MPIGISTKGRADAAQQNLTRDKKCNDAAKCFRAWTKIFSLLSFANEI